MSAETFDADELASLASAATLLGQLLLFELDRRVLASLAEPAVAEALADLGVHVPSVPDDGARGGGASGERTAGAGRPGSAVLDELAAEFYAALLQPAAGGPPVQSLWTAGAYEGDAAVVLRGLAEHAGYELDAEAARGAPPDHLGSILLLWAATYRERPEIAERLARDHLAWARPALARLRSGRGFYAEVARAVETWIDCVAGAASRVSPGA